MLYETTTSTNLLRRGVKALLEAELPALAHEQGLPLTHEVLTYEPALKQAGKSPSIYITVPNISPAAPAGFGGTNRHFTTARTLLVLITTAETDPEGATEQVTAWADLVLQVLTGDLTFGGTTTNARYQGTQIGIPEGGALTPAALLTFLCDRWKALGAD